MRQEAGVATSCWRQLRNVQLTIDNVQILALGNKCEIGASRDDM
jgi:hypothetical protein